MILPQQQFFIFPCVKRKESKERWEWRLNLSLNIYRNIYTVERGLRLLDFLFDICQNHWSVSQSAWSGWCCIEMAASHWRRNWSWSVKISCLVVFWVRFSVCLRDRIAFESLERENAWMGMPHKCNLQWFQLRKSPPPPTPEAISVELTRAAATLTQHTSRRKEKKSLKGFKTTWVMIEIRTGW